ncbi:LysR family transcriptional regulator [Bailinhaonella thermotolerans]|uniref:LysR family transcriptional regulator n=1 Tax=Bailinhaonella thermotolerans TaxID=1070861 RepID=A0A3A4A8E2_9ACTN|nr:LysR family transcriptional regulator [Bailinhaonella thermotolerans]RJL24249.1 LysR family transcriptional regulator [Bailinhaonella thermotolerans]
MEIRQLRHFVAVATHGSFTAAARAELIVQSALSTSIRKLERELGAELFERTGRRPVLTPAGLSLLPAARALLADAEAAKDAVAAVTGLAAGRLVIGTIQTLTSVDLAAELAAFQREQPGVQISVRDATVGELLDGLLARELDLAFVDLDGIEPPEGLAVYATWEDELVLITSPDHPLATAGHAYLSELGEESFVDFREGTGVELAVRRRAADCGLHRRITCEVTQTDLLVELVRSGLGIAIVPRRIGERHGLPCVTIRQPTPPRRVSLAGRAPVPRNPAAQAFLAHLAPAPDGTPDVTPS